MKTKDILLFLAGCLLFLSCTERESSSSGDVTDDFLVRMEQPSGRVSLDENMHMTWGVFDRYSLFSPFWHTCYRNVESGDFGYSAILAKDERNGSSYEEETGIDLCAYYLVYPFSEENKVEADGTLRVPFNGTVMVGATRNLDDREFFLKSACGYLRVPVSGAGRITKVTFEGHSGEILRGSAVIRASYEDDPLVTMLQEPGGLRYVSLDYSENPVDLFSMTEQVFTFTLPPTSFQKGFTVSITNSDGKVQYFSTQESRTLSRNAWNQMEALYLPASLVELEEDLDRTFKLLGAPNGVFQYPSTRACRADDFGFIAAALSQDAEGPDYIYPNNDYSWFKVCGDYSARVNPDYANPYMRFSVSWNVIRSVNKMLKALSFYKDSNSKAMYLSGQAKALRAFCYLHFAQQYAFGSNLADKCVPVYTEETLDERALSRATLSEVFTLVFRDLNEAIELIGDTKSISKQYFDRSVLYGLRARANLVMGNYGEAASDAEKAAEGYTPASIAEVSVPSFMDISEHNWIWGIDMVNNDIKAVRSGYYATSSSWLRSFSGDSYTAGAGCYPLINNLLYELIPATDVRKGWWVNEDLESPLLAAVTWNGKTGNDIPPMVITDVKEPFPPYTNVKFGMAKVGEVDNDDDYPLMRVEEMILIQAEALYRAGSEAEGKALLEDFVKTYRDPSYSLPDETTRSFLNEVWFQRRIELWGEGFGLLDVIRFGKPLVRFIPGKESNVPEAFRFNIAADNPVLLMNIPDSYLKEHPFCAPNRVVTQPVPGDGAELRDGITN